MPARTHPPRAARTAKVERYEDIYDKEFSFGKNWQKFLELVTEEKVELAKKSLKEILQVKELRGKVFLDIGCGSGLFSLAAIQLGAKQVISVDVDAHSVAAAEYLRMKYRIDPKTWIITTGSALDKKFLTSLHAKPDIVYSWGVLHHTGEMWTAIKNVAALVPPKKHFAIAIYNKHTNFPTSETWRRIKRFYAKRGRFIRWCMRCLYMVYFTLGMLAYRKNPIKYIKHYGKGSARGMDFYRDVEDWLGGYPYEFASASEMRDFFASLGFSEKYSKLTPREGCNEFLFVRK